MVQSVLLKASMAVRDGSILLAACDNQTLHLKQWNTMEWNICVCGVGICPHITIQYHTFHPIKVGNITTFSNNLHL